MSDRWHLRPLSDIVDLRHPSGRPGATGRRWTGKRCRRDTVREGAAMDRTRVSVRGIDASGCRRAVGLALAMIAALAVLQPEPARAQAAHPGGQDPSKSSLARYVPKQDNLYLLPGIRRARCPCGRLEELGGLQAAERHQARCAHRGPRGQGIELAQQSAPPDKRIKPAELIGLFKLVGKQGFAVGFWGEEPHAGVTSSSLAAPTGPRSSACSSWPHRDERKGHPSGRRAARSIRSGRPAASRGLLPSRKRPSAGRGGRVVDREGRPGHLQQARLDLLRPRRPVAERRRSSDSHRLAAEVGRIRADRRRVLRRHRLAAAAAAGRPARPRRSEAHRDPVGHPGRCAARGGRSGGPAAEAGTAGDARPADVHDPVAPAPARRADRVRRALARPGQDLRPVRRAHQADQPARAARASPGSSRPSGSGSASTCARTSWHSSVPGSRCTPRPPPRRRRPIRPRR